MEATVGSRDARLYLARKVAGLLGNVLFGVSLGLLSYYGVTEIVGRVERSALQGELPRVGSPSLEVLESKVATAPQGAVLDLEGYAGQDLAYWETLPLGGVFGRMVVPRMGLDTIVIKGVRPVDLRRGPGWIDHTDLPGRTGMVGISGHRTTYLHPFGRLDRVRLGDTVDLYSPYRRYRYRVERKFVVTPDRTDVVAHTESPQLTLTACHPPYSARQRLIVQCRLVEVRRLEE